MSCELEGKDWAALRDEAKNLEAIATELFKQGDVKRAKATYRAAANRAILALYAAPIDNERTRKALSDLVQSLCEKMEEPELKQKTAA